MSEQARADRYIRIRRQLEREFAKTADVTARMATAAALLHHKMPHFFWTGFYLLRGGELIVGPYQGSLACLVLRPQHSGVCWACVDRAEPVLVADVHAFPGHIACDSRSRSEVVVPLRDRAGAVVGVFDIDSDQPGAFDAIDQDGLVAVADMIHGFAAATDSRS